MIEGKTLYYAQCDACGLFFPGEQDWKSPNAISFASVNVAMHNIRNFGWQVTYTMNEPAGCVCRKCGTEADFYMNQNLSKQ